MKKIALLVGVAALSTSAFADIGLKVELGYEAATVAPSYGDGWFEDFGDNEPSGAAVNVEWQVIGVPGMYLALDYADLEDEEDVYESKYTTSQKRTVFDVGYEYTLNDSASVTAAIRYADIEWEWLEDYYAGGEWVYNAEDSGVSLVVGAEKSITESVSAGTAFSAGFETGVEVFVELGLTEKFSVKAEWSKKSYELGDFEYDSNGSINSPADQYGDGDYEFDTDALRVSAAYKF